MAHRDEPEELEPSAFVIVLQLLSKGIQPYCVLIDDELHIIASKPTNKVSLAQMINRDGNVRDGYMVGVMKLVRDAIEEEAFA